MVNKTTILYYTSNREEEGFEKNIQKTLIETSGGLPIISISQKPIDLGENICVGDIGQSYLNEWKQLLVGLKAAKTEFCIAAESDCLYPPDYFKFVPPRNDIVYRYDNVWACWKNKRKFWKKPRSEGAQMCGREFWIHSIEKALSYSNDPKEVVRKIFNEEERWNGDPVITFLTGDGIGTKTSLNRIKPVEELPYWGNAKLICKEMFNEEDSVN